MSWGLRLPGTRDGPISKRRGALHRITTRACTAYHDCMRTWMAESYAVQRKKYSPKMQVVDSPMVLTIQWYTVSPELKHIASR